MIFPVTHGTNGEDGRLQGFLNLVGLSYVGPDPVGASMAMDKVVAKQRVEQAGVDVTEGHSCRICFWSESEENKEKFVKECIEKLGEDMYVKPASLGSSVGVNPASGFDECMKACEEAFRYDSRVSSRRKQSMREK